jgi:hypothetical protein
VSFSVSGEIKSPLTALSSSDYGIRLQVRPYVGLSAAGSNWNYFREIWCWEFLRKSVDKFKV